MDSTARTIAKNTSVLMASQVITWGLSTLLVIFMPRYLGATAIGQINIAVALWAIVAMFAVLGMDTFLLKEVSRDHRQIDHLLGIVLAIRLFFFGLGALAAFGYSQLAGYSLQTSLVIYIMGVSYLIGTITGTLDACLKGLERMEYPAITSVAYNALMSILCITLLLLGKDVIAIAAASIVGALSNLLILSFSLRKLHQLRFSINWKLARDVLRNSIPYWFVALGLVLYQQVDALVISWFVNDQAVGWYSAADRLFASLLFVPTVFFTAIFPTLTRTYANASDSFYKLARKSFDLMFVFSVPIGLGIFVIANQLVILLYGNEFAKSGPVLAILGLVLILTYTNMLLGYLLVSMDKQKVWAIVLIGATLATIPLDIVLVPWCEKNFANGALGGGISFMFTEIGQTVVGISLLPKGTLSKANTLLAARTLLAGLGMAAATWLVHSYFIAIPVLIGVCAYIILVFALRILSKEDWQLINAIWLSLTNKIRGRFVKAVELKG